MSLSLQALPPLKMPSISLRELESAPDSLSKVMQEIFSNTYLQPFDRDPDLKLKDNEFEVVDATICRVTHGATHAARVAAYVKILHVFRTHVYPQDASVLKTLFTATSLHESHIIDLAQIVGCLHDAARRAEVTDRWDKQSGELCLIILRQLFIDLDESVLLCFSKMIEHKDDPDGYLDFLRSHCFSQDQIGAWNYLRELIHDADCLDIMRVRKNFDLTFLDIFKKVQHPVQFKSLLDLVIEIRDLIHKQADMYKDLTIIHPFPSKKPATLKKHFSIEIKKTYEHAPLVYTKILQDMAGFSWLKTACAPLSAPLSSQASAPPIYPKAKLEELFDELVIFRKKDCRIFHGGPVDHPYGMRWIMPICFIDDHRKIRSAFEACFINCTPFDESLQDVPVYQVAISDMDLKTRNIELEEVKAFYELMDTKNRSIKAILLREPDLLNICYPHIYNFYLYSEKKPEDREIVLSFLKENYGIKSTPKEVGPQLPFLDKVDIPFKGIIERKRVTLSLGGSHYPFFVEHYINSSDPWGCYYLYKLAIPETAKSQSPISLRLDSGCTSGMVYLDASCSCQKELDEGLLCLVKDNSSDSVLIHIPAHDGRGMGMAPKGETEIYKTGGKGKLSSSAPKGDVEAAQYLYKTDHIDIRTYDGAIALLKQKGIDRVRLISRSRSKIQALEKAGISVIL